MNIHSDSIDKKEQRAAASDLSNEQKNTIPVQRYVDNRRNAIAQQNLQRAINTSPKSIAQRKLQKDIDDSPSMKRSKAYLAQVNYQSNAGSQAFQLKAVVQRMTEKQQGELLGRWRTIEDRLDEIFLENNKATEPISMELEAIRTLLSRSPDTVDFAVLREKISAIERWTNQPPHRRGEIVGDQLTRDLLGFPNPRAQAQLSTLLRDASDVHVSVMGVEVYLDIDQLKHQDGSQPIGTRVTRGGNKFNPANSGSKDWHRANTLLHMGQWAASLGVLAEGEMKFHGQATPVDGIHYEGFCTVIGGKRYVLFHCYPADGSEFLL